MTKRSTQPRDADDARWQAVLARDASADGAFYFSVATTGVYCRPSCAARKPKRANVAFHATPAAAEAAGFRACKRCRPKDAPHAAQIADKVAQACRTIAEAEEEPSLAALAAAADLSPHHFHRVFKAATSVTPKAYAMGLRRQRVAANLKEANTVTEAIHDSGFNSAGRFYAQSDAMLGMTPTAFRAGGDASDIRYAAAPCSLGQILVAATDKGICAIFFGDDGPTLRAELAERFPRANLIAADRDFAALVAQVVAFVEAPHTSFDLPLDIRGTAFQQRVWQVLRTIPPGETLTYAEVAERIGAPKASRAVGSACGANPIAVAIPCHRVVRKPPADSVSGYRWGPARKRQLLAREKRGQ